MDAIGIISFHIEYNQALEFLKNNKIRGYIYEMNGVHALIEQYSGRNDASYFDNGIFNKISCKLPSRLPFITEIKVGSRIVKEKQVVVDRVNTRGYIEGWSDVDVNGDPSLVFIFVDNVLLGSVRADLFRIDLLKVGIGTGVCGFRFRPPNSVLDGHIHTVTVRSGSSQVTKQIRFPFHFDEKRPWVSFDAASDQVEQVNEKDFQIARWNVIEKGEKSRIIELLDAHPSLIFRDLGWPEHVWRKNNSAPNDFHHLLNVRWAKLYGPDKCGPDCCKERGSVFDIETMDQCRRPLRHFASKLVMKEYAQRLGASLPDTLFVIEKEEDFHEAELPESYILKPVQDSGAGLFLMRGDLNLLDGFRYSRQEIGGKISSYLKANKRGRFMVEPFICQEGTDPTQPFIPLDYKFHCFGGKARIVHVDDRNTRSRDAIHRSQSWLSRDWVEAPARMRITEQQNQPIIKPKCYEEMLFIADKIASAAGDYIRVDLYATDNGPVLGELTTYSHSGLGFTEYGQFVLAQAWEIFRED